IPKKIIKMSQRLETLLPEAEVSILQVNTSNHLATASNDKSRPPISILPDDPKHVIKMVLERFSHLSLKYSNE
ncbi:9756_t:CDS:1, partial [Acaulospora colombiana]